MPETPIRKALIPGLLIMALAACNMGTAGGKGPDSDTQASSSASEASRSGEADSMAASDPAPDQQAEVRIPDPEERPTMQLQVVLDRLGFTPGVVDGKMGLSTRNAITGFQEANGLETTGKRSDALDRKLRQWSNIPATRVVTIPASFAQGPFKQIPESAEAKAKMDRLGYESLDEKLAERFHTTIETLKMLNPGGKPAGMDKASASASAATMSSGSSSSPPASSSASASASPSATSSSPASETSNDSYFHAGQMIRVPNVGADRIAAGSVDDDDWRATLAMLGVGSDQPQAKKIVVSKSEETLKVYDADDKLIGMYTATMGSTHDPLPLGNWKVVGIAHNPPFQFDPSLFWDVPDSEAERTLPPGPNGPVGVVWIDLSKEHYGIHGTSAPQTIGRVQSHGCVRLTNWDAARLAQMVSPGTKVIFES